MIGLQEKIKSMIGDPLEKSVLWKPLPEEKKNRVSYTSQKDYNGQKEKKYVFSSQVEYCTIRKPNYFL